MPSNHLILSSPSPTAFNLSQHQSPFQWVSSLHQVAKASEFHLQHQSFQWIFRINFLQDWLIWSPCNPRDSQESSPIPQFESISSSVLSFLYGPTLCDPMDCSISGFPVLHYLPEFAQTHVHWAGDDAIQPSHPLSSASSPPSIFPTSRVFSNESGPCIRWPKYWSFSFGISPSNEYLGLISFRVDWFDLLAIQGTLKSHLQHHSLKASILQN